jgi:glucose/arabinose dehydrogenase
LAITAATLTLAACGSAGEAVPAEASDSVFQIEEMAQFSEPWAMTFLPDGRALVTEKAGRLLLWSDEQPMVEVSGVPEVDYGGQGGLGDVVLHPEFAENGWVYISYAEAGTGNTRGAAVARGRLVVAGDDSASLNEIEVVWRQTPKTSRRGHYSHRIAFSPDGLMFISSGDRQALEPAQDLANNLGTIVRLNDDGSLPEGNPFADRGGVTAQIWSYGHRNVLGLAFDADGGLWDIEHGPAGGDEINQVVAGDNYGWPLVSNGNHYNGTNIPDHYGASEYHAPAISWTPVIAPGDMIFYSGEMFADWQGQIIAAGMLSQALVRVEISGDSAREIARYGFENRIREVEQAADGALWVLEDERNGSGGRMLRLTPAE